MPSERTCAEIAAEVLDCNCAAGDCPNTVANVTAALQSERDRLAAVEAQQAIDRAKIEADRQDLAQAQAAQQAEADRIAALHRDLVRAQRRAEAADLRRQAFAIPDPVAPTAHVPTEPSPATMAEAARLDGEAQAFDVEMLGVGIPAVTDTFAPAEAERIRALGELARAKENPWREVEGIADVIVIAHRDMAKRLRDLALRHGGSVPDLEGSLQMATERARNAVAADTASREANESARARRSELDSKASALRAEAKALREAAQKAADVATRESFAAWQTADRDYQAARNSVAEQRRELIARAERIEQ